MTTHEEKPPLHPFEVRISIGGNTWEYVLRAMEELAKYIEDRGPEAGLSSGGYGGCHSVDVTTRDISPEAYRKELGEWHERVRAVR